MSPPEFDYARAAQREPVEGTATLSWEASGASQECLVRLCNLTSHGMQALSPKPVDPGTPVFVSGKRYECAGEIRYCLAAGEEFRFGLEFRSDPYPVAFTGRPQ